MSNVLEHLKPTTWYKVLMIVSVAAFLIVLASQRDTLAMIFGGAFLIGLGEWKNHRRFIEFGRIAGHLAKRDDVERKATVWGVTLQIIGALLVAYGTYRAFGFSLPFG